MMMVGKLASSGHHIGAARGAHQREDVASLQHGPPVEGVGLGAATTRRLLLYIVRNPPTRCATQ
jgi:hypothetical protein